MTQDKLEHFAHRIQLQVRWADMDAMGHVNNAKFLTYAESSRIAYFDDLHAAAAGLWSRDSAILAHISADFIEQLAYPAALEIGTRAAKLGRTSLQLQTGIFCGGRAAGAVKAVMVWFDYTHQKPVPIPEVARNLIRQREIVKPEEG
jgi:acyl-CoA thioester hydrolase